MADGYEKKFSFFFTEPVYHLSLKDYPATITLLDIRPAGVIKPWVQALSTPRRPVIIDLPYITGDEPGVGGRLKTAPEHFVVEEIPLYHPEGTGEHIYIRLKRTGWNTRDIVLRLAETFQIREADIGTAGLKDKEAVTVQTFSLHLPRLDPDEAGRLIAEAMPEVTIEWLSRHRNKLKTGHLLGNRFKVVLVGWEGDTARVDRLAALLRQRGLPNFYGPQRFGLEGDNARRGRDILLGRSREKKWLKKFLLSAYQSHLFNRYLTERIQRGWFQTILAGDVAKKSDSGGLFLVDEAEVDQARFDRGEITFTGPMYGRKMKSASGEPGMLEAAIFDAEELDRTALSKAGLDGSRRAGRIDPAHLTIEPHPDGLLFDFALPKGSYATVVMREFMKTPWPTDKPGPEPS